MAISNDEQTQYARDYREAIAANMDAFPPLYREELKEVTYWSIVNVWTGWDPTAE